MEDRFKLRVWDNVVKKYLTDDDVFEMTDGILDNLYDLLNEDNRRFILGSHDLVFEQCAGLKDKNEKLIYEGNIVETHDYTTEHSEIVFDKGCYVLKSKDAAMYEHLSNYEKECEIIGNIHENPELLEEK